MNNLEDNEKIQYDIRYKGDEFVGIELKDNKILVHLPIGYRYIKGEEKTSNLKKIMMAIAKNSRYMGNATNEKCDFDFILALKIIDNYIKYGLYKQTELKRKVNFRGRINWQRTIRQNQIYLEDRTIYTNVVNEYMDYKSEKEIQAIQEFCLYQISKVIGPLFAFYYPKKFDKFNSLAKIDILNKELKNTNDDNKIELLENLISFVKNTKFEAIENGNISIKYGKFELIYQNFVNVFGIKNIQDYYPRAQYCCINTNKALVSIQPSKPDTIIKDNNNLKEFKDIVFLLDAKYKHTGNNFEGFPNEYEIFKQIRYKIYLEKKLRDNKDYRKIINAFILPKPLEEIVKVEKNICSKCRHKKFDFRTRKNNETGCKRAI